MQILPRTEIQFDVLATQVANNFIKNSVPLNDSIIKIANERVFNPEQIRRLVEIANTFTTVNVIKTAEDKKVEFELADIDVILASTHFKEGNSVKEACVQSNNTIPTKLPFTRTTQQEKAFDKLANYQTHTLLKANLKVPKGVTTIFQLEKKIADLTNTKMATELKVQDDIDFIVSEFSKWESPNFSKFANESIEIYGNKAEPVLSRIADYLGEQYQTEKIAYYIDDSDVLLKKTGSIIDGLLTIIKVSKQLDDTKQQLTDTWKNEKENSKCV